MGVLSPGISLPGPLATQVGTNAKPTRPTLLLAPVCSQVHLEEQVLVDREWGLKTGYDGWQEGHHKLVYSGKQKRGFKSQPGVL